MTRPNRTKGREKAMFGRIRALPSSPQGMEVPPSKILKDDSFSIYGMEGNFFFGGFFLSHHLFDNIPLPEPPPISISFI
ncbi:hypothetical protein L6164_010976 [Bauhinia variegata]|uniref:Uncharacterized protein n=1 Tax=Bauhinia variegata TaxID=167791 RepID=A0ACB9P6J6_BAUVA|nr:hypothetical protein L6164_010976 [Bauhinia variegata]